LAKKRGHGEGSISQRKDGRWMGQITLGINPATKKAKRLTFYGKTRKEVQEKIREALNQKDKGMLGEPSKLTLQEWLKTWLEDYKKRELKESTWESYKSLIEDHINPDLGMVKLSKLRTNDIQRFYNEKLNNGRKRKIEKDGEEISGLSTRTVKYIHTVLSGALKQAVKEGIIPVNPADATTQPRQQKHEITPLTTDQVRQLLEDIKDDWMYPVYVTALGTGLRRGELLGLKWEALDLEAGMALIKRELVQVKGKVKLQEYTKYVSYKELKAVMADLKEVYGAVSEEAALYALEEFKEKWGSKYPQIYRSWETNWANLSGFFKYPDEMRRLIYTTNAVEGFHRMLRKFTKTKTNYPTDDALRKSIYLAIKEISRKWYNPVKNWGIIFGQFTVFYGDRFTEAEIA
jgi:integrase